MQMADKPESGMPIPPTAEYHRFCEVAVQVAREAGQLIRSAFFDPRRAAPDTKEANAVDLVTATDRMVEELVFTRLRSAFPTYSFIGEESTAAGTKSELTDMPTVICDPIDGTTNFVHGNPYVCISLGLVVGRRPAAGVIFNPITNELYVTHLGCGAYLSGQRLPLVARPPPKQLSDCLMLAEVGHDRSAQFMDDKLTTWNRLMTGTLNMHGLRCMGSAALNLCMIARGGCDIYWELGLHAWDLAAGILMVTEAGGLAVGDEFLDETRRKEWHADVPFDIMGRKALAVRGSDPKLMWDLVPHLIDCKIKRD